MKRKFLDWDLVGDINPVITIKKFESRDESNSRAVFGFLGLPGFECKVQKRFGCQLLLQQCEVSAGHLDGKNQTRNYVENWTWKLRLVNI